MIRCKLVIISLSILLLACFSAGNNMSYASNSNIIPVIVFDKSPVKAGDTLEVAIQLTGTRQEDKTNSVAFEIEYDSNSFELETGDPERDIIDGYIKFTTKNSLSSGESTGKINVMYVDPFQDTKLQEGAEVFRVKFKVKSMALSGDKSIKLLPVSMIDSDFNIYNINNGQAMTKTITVNNPGTELPADNDVSQVKVLINGQPLSFDVQPIIINGRTLVPIRAIAEALGAVVSWDEKTSSVTFKQNNTTVKLVIGDSLAYINDKSIKLDVPAFIISGRTLVPLRFIGETLKADVDWDEDTYTVKIKTRH